MAWTTPTTRTTGTLISAAIYNTDLVDNLIALRAGSIAIASQAANDLVYASSTTQFARLANGTTGQVLTATTSAAPAWATTARCHAYHSTTQSVADTGTALALNSEDFDSGTLHDTVTNNSRITVPTTGIYLVVAHSGTLVTNTNCEMTIRVNGTTEYAGTEQGDNALRMEATVLLSLAATDYVQLFGRNGSGSANWGSATRRQASALMAVQVA